MRKGNVLCKQTIPATSTLAQTTPSSGQEVDPLCIWFQNPWPAACLGNSLPVATKMVSTVYGRAVAGSVQHHSSFHTTATAATELRSKPSDTGSVHSETPSRWQKTLNMLLPAQKSSKLSSQTCRCVAVAERL